MMLDEIQTYQTVTGTTHLWPFVEAETQFQFTKSQHSTFSLLEKMLVQMLSRINSEYLDFKIGMTPDDEIFISRNSVEGVSNLLIYEDGTMAHSFIPYKGSNKSDFLHFFEPLETINYEHVLLEFFSH